METMLDEIVGQVVYVFRRTCYTGEKLITRYPLNDSLTKPNDLFCRNAYDDLKTVEMVEVFNRFA